MKPLICYVSLKLMLLPVMVVAQDLEVAITAVEAGDYATALRQWRPLAEQGNEWAQFGLGWMYAEGKGVPLDYTKGVRWYRLSAEQGNAAAQYNLSLMYFAGNGVPKDYVSAHMWFNISSMNGDPEAAALRERVQSKMTAADIAKAQQRASACMASGYQECD